MSLPALLIQERRLITANLEDLEKRIKVLEDIEAIKKLKAKYFHSIDRKLWDEYAECFSEDATFEADSGRREKTVGLEAIVRFIKEEHDPGHRIFTHQGHDPEIEIINDTTAKGVWSLYFYHEDMKKNIRRQAGDFYYDDYVKEKGRWRIKHLRLISIYSRVSRIED